MTRERLELFVAPRHPMGEHIPKYLELADGALRGGSDPHKALAAWRKFAGAAPVLGVWGIFALDLLRGLGDEPRESVDLRHAAIHRLKGLRPGGVERAASLLCASPVAPVEQGRCGRRMGALEKVLEGLQGA
jgi:hypothetical protein